LKKNWASWLHDFLMSPRVILVCRRGVSRCCGITFNSKSALGSSGLYFSRQPYRTSSIWSVASKWQMSAEWRRAILRTSVRALQNPQITQSCPDGR